MSDALQIALETEQRALEELYAIERGESVVSPPDNAEHFCLVVEHKTSNGWTFGIFDDCGEWDYVQYFVTPEGVRVDPWEDWLDGYECEEWPGHPIHDGYQRLRNYSAEDHDALHRWPSWT